MTLLALAGIGLRYKKVRLHSIFRNHTLDIDSSYASLNYVTFGDEKDENLVLIANGPMFAGLEKDFYIT